MTGRLQVKDWDRCFENNRTRKKSDQDRCIIPNKQGGAGYKMLLEMENGEALYGAFHAMILYLSKQSIRDGWLTKDGTSAGDPITAKFLAARIKFSQSTVQKMLEAVTRDIGWLIDHSAEKIVESVAYPGKRVDIKFIALAQKFHKIQVSNHPHENELQKANVVRTTLAGARNLEYFHIERDWPIETIKILLDWVPRSSFWCYQIRSLASIRRISRINGSLKFDNALAQMNSEEEAELMDGDQMMEDMHKRNLGTDDYERIKNERTGEILWRRK